MRLLKKLTAVLICAVMAVGALPAFAAESGAEMTFEIHYDANSLPDNDELFASYVNQMFYGANDFTLFGNYGESLFSGTDLTVYNEMKTQVQSIAAGESTSTVVTVSNISWPYEELGLTSSAENNEVFAAIRSKVTLLIDCLFYDCPYEFYWCDKSTEGISTRMSRYETYAYVSVDVTYYAAEAYQDGSDTSVNPDKAASAKQAAENALEIVAENEGKTDREKLEAYRETICGLVTYNYAAANGIADGSVSYGDPWQMIYVFDGDEETNVVCEGYSKAFQYLCDMSDFDSVVCYAVTGRLDGGDHMWNIVTLDGVNYFCDVTNSDVLKTDLFFDAMEVASSSDAGCVIKIGNTTAEYVYGSETLSLYSADILTLGIRVRGVSLSESEMTLGEGDKVLLEPVFDPENATNQNVVWESSDKSVAMVEDGVVTAISAGNAVIEVKTLDGGYTAECEIEVIVTVPVESVSLDQSSLSLTVGGNITLEATVLPDDATDRTVVWHSSNESVAAVEDGVVTAISAGEAVITATSGEKSASCVVTVQEDDKRVIDYGDCGDNLTWVFDSDYVLTISGTGEMYDFEVADNAAQTPWSGWLVKKIVIEEGVTSIGDWAFGGKSAVTEVEMPSTLTRIGQYAFNSCRALEKVVIPDSVTQIDDAAFSYCTALNEAYLSSGMPEASYACFYECTSLTTVHVPIEVISLGLGTFYHTAVTDIYYGGTEEQWSAVDTQNSYLASDVTVHFTEPDITSVTVERTDDAVIVTVDFDNPTDGSVLAVGYGQSGQMVDIESVSGHTAELSAETQSVKVFLWESLSSMVPLCDSVTGQVE